MPETTVNIQEQTVPGPEAAGTPEIPLIQRVARMEPEKKPVEEPTNQFGLSKEDYDAVQSDPVLSKFYKSMNSDYIKKTQEVAEQRRALETQPKKQPWTMQKVQELVNDPEFVQAAQTFSQTNNPQGSGLTDEEWSTLNDKEKAQLAGLETKVNHLTQVNQENLKIQQDANLKQTYANYNSQAVDDLLSDMMSNRLQATREHLWKVLDYESAVDRAYRLGRADERGGIQEKVIASSPEGINAQPNQTIQPEKEESNMNFWKRITTKRLAESKAGIQTRM